MSAQGWLGRWLSPTAQSGCRAGHLRRTGASQAAGAAVLPARPGRGGGGPKLTGSSSDLPGTGGPLLSVCSGVSDHLQAKRECPEGRAQGRARCLFALRSTLCPVRRRRPRRRPRVAGGSPAGLCPPAPAGRSCSAAGPRPSAWPSLWTPRRLGWVRPQPEHGPPPPILPLGPSMSPAPAHPPQSSPCW